MDSFHRAPEGGGWRERERRAGHLTMLPREAARKGTLGAIESRRLQVCRRLVIAAIATEQLPTRWRRQTRSLRCSKKMRPRLWNRRPSTKTEGSRRKRMMMRSKGVITNIELVNQTTSTMIATELKRMSTTRQLDWSRRVTFRQAERVEGESQSSQTERSTRQTFNNTRDPQKAVSFHHLLRL